MKHFQLHTLFLDMDGVLADFDAGANRALSTTNSYKWEFVHGTVAFWTILDNVPDFFLNLPPMPDMLELWDAVEHLNPTVLTALPRRDAVDVNRQKREWVAKYLGGNVPVITCETWQKPHYCNLGSVLVDDRGINENKWRDAGGEFILHTNAKLTLEYLSRIGVL